MVAACYGRRRAPVAMGGAVCLALLACQCGGGSPQPDDAAVEDSADAASDEDSNDVGLDADSASETDPSDVAEDVRDVVEVVPCDASDRDVPVWERSVGECWHDDPPPRDLSSLWFEPEAGCEQISYGDYFVDGTTQDYDVWDDTVVFGSRGIFFVDLGSRTERNLEPDFFDEPTDTFLGDSIEARTGGLTERSVVYFGVHRHAGPAAEAPSDGCYVITWDIADRMKRLVYAATCPVGDMTGSFRVDDMSGRLVLGPVALDNRTTQENIYALDVDSLDLVLLTSYPYGRAFWRRSRLWANSGVASLEGHRLLLFDLTTRSVRPLDLATGAEWQPDLYGQRLCWLWAENSLGAIGRSVDCMDLDSETQWRASDDLTSFKHWPAVYGDWVAWEDVRELSPGIYGRTVGLYHRATDQRWRLDNRTTWFSSDARDAGCPRLWGDFVYFLVYTPSDPTSRIFRCDLRTLFPEAYE